MSLRRQRCDSLPPFALLPLTLALSMAFAPTLSSAAVADIAPTAVKAAPSAQIFLAAHAQVPLQALAPLRISITAQEDACKERWGDNWRDNCFARLGRPGSLASAVQMSPAVRGQWRWENATTLIFYPQDPWPAATAFTVNLGGLELPHSATLAATQISWKTAPLATSTKSAQFWADPSIQGGDYLTFQAQFSTAITDTAAFEKSFSLAVTGTADGVSFGTRSFIWSPDKTSVYIKVPVTTLPTQALVATAQLPNIAGTLKVVDSRTVVPQGYESTQIPVDLPGRTTIFHINQAQISTRADDQLNEGYRIAFTASLPTTAAALAQHLEIWALPRTASAQAVSDADWSQAPVIDDTVLARAKQIPVTVDTASAPNAPAVLIPADVAQSTQFLYLRVKQGLTAAAAGVDAKALPALSKDWQGIVKVPRLDAKIEFLQPGNLLTLSGSRTLSLYCTGVERLVTRVSRIRDEFLAVAAQEYNPLANDGYIDDKVVAQEQTLDLPAGKPGEARFATVNLANMLRSQGPGLFQVETTGWIKNKDGQYEEVTRTSRRVLATDTAVLVKQQADETWNVYAASFLTQAPIPGALASLMAANGTVLQSVRTNDAGLARFDSTKGFTRERRPVAVLVQAPGPAGGGAISIKEDTAWLSLSDDENRAWLTAASGRNVGENHMTAMAFADRGVARPGETLHFGALIKSTDNTELPKNLPLQALATGPLGEKLLSTTVSPDAMGLLTVNLPLAADQAAGPVRLDIKLPGTDTVLASTTALVEDFVPDTLQLDAALPEGTSAGWTAPNDLLLPVTLKSLFGTAAKDRRVQGELRLQPVNDVSLPGWEGFSFGSTANAVLHANTRKLTQVTTDGEGKASITVPLSGTSASLSRASVTLEGLEAQGGRAVTKNLSWLVSSAPYLVGVRLTGTPQPKDSLVAGAPAQVEIAVVGKDLQPRAKQTLKVTIGKTHYVTELVTSDGGYLSYRDSPVTEPVVTQDVTTDDKGLARIELPTNEQGSFSVTVANEQGPQALLSYATLGNALPNRTKELPTAKLRARLGSSELKADEKTPLAILSPFDGFGLLTVEGDKVDSARWIRVKAGENTVDFTAPENVYGRRYVNIALVRSPAAASKFLSGYAETTLPVTIGREEKTLPLSLTAPATMTEANNIPVTIKAGTKSRVLLWAVDEGVLGLTNYKTPDPLFSLLEDRALEVQTRRVLDKLMPEGPEGLTTFSAFGGDREAMAKALAGAMSNPFKRSMPQTAIWWGGVVDVTSDGTTVTAKLPAEFNGKVRFMAVGVSEKSFGSTQADVTVAQPLALEVVAPRAVAPHDTFQLAATVSHTSDVPSATHHQGSVSVAAPAGWNVSPAQVTFTFPEKGAAQVKTVLKAPAEPMSADLQVQAKTAALSTKANVGVSVRPASLRTVWQKGDLTTMPAGGTLSLTAPVSLYAYQARTELVASAQPLPWVAALSAAPASWGWATLYDVTAAAWPYELLAADPSAAGLLGEASAVSKEAAARHDAAVAYINRNLSRDGVSVLTGTPGTLFTSAFALDYLLGVKDKLAVPTELIAQLRERLLALSSRDVESLDDFRTTAYALWVLTREGTITTNRIASLLQNASSRFPQWRQDASAAFISAALRRLRLVEQADELVSGLQTLPDAALGYPWTAPLARALAAAALAENPDLVKKGLPLFDDVLEDVRQALRTGDVEPQYAALAARAIVALQTNAADKTAKMVLRCVKRAPGFSAQSDALAQTADGQRLSAPGCLQFSVSGVKAKDSLFWQITQEGFVKDQPKSAQAEGLEVEREYLNADGKPATHFVSGDLITARITLRAYSGQRRGAAEATNVVLTDLFPGGLESADAPGVQAEGASSSIRGDDRIFLRVDEVGASPVTITYRLRAVTPGSYVAPALEAKSLTESWRRARSVPGRIEVK